MRHRLICFAEPLVAMSTLVLQGGINILVTWWNVLLFTRKLTGIKKKMKWSKADRYVRVCTKRDPSTVKLLSSIITNSWPGDQLHDVKSLYCGEHKCVGHEGYARDAYKDKRGLNPCPPNYYDGGFKKYKKSWPIKDRYKRVCNLQA